MYYRRNEEKIIPVSNCTKEEEARHLAKITAPAKEFIKEVKASRRSFTATIEMDEYDTVKISNLVTTKRIHYSALRLDQGKGLPEIPFYTESYSNQRRQQESSVEDFFDDDDLEGVEFLEEDNEEQDLDLEQSCESIVEESTFQEAWDVVTEDSNPVTGINTDCPANKKETNSNNFKKNDKYQSIFDSIQEEADIEDNEVDADLFEDEYNVIDDTEVIHITPREEKLESFYYKEGYIVDYDFIQRSPKKGYKQNTYYGYKDIFDFYSIQVNKVFNFLQNDGIESTSSIVIPGKAGMENHTKFQREIHSGIATLTRVVDLQGHVIRYIYTEPGMKITVNLLNRPLKQDMSFSKLPYSIDTFEVGKKAIREAYTNKNFSKTIILPHVSHFANIYNIGYVKNSNYEILDTENKVQDMVELLMKPEYINVDTAIDIESTGLEFYYGIKRPDKIVTYQFSWDDHQAVCIPIRMRYEKNVNPQFIKELFIKTGFLTKRPYIAHNGGDAECRFLRGEGLRLKLVHDTMISIKHLLPFITKGKVYLTFGRAIDDLLYQATREEMIDLEKHIFNPLGIQFDFSLLNAMYEIWYACPDVDRLRALWKIITCKLNPLQMSAYLTNVKYTAHLGVRSSFPGVGVNVPKLRADKSRELKMMDTLGKFLYDATKDDPTGGENPDTLNIDSPASMADYLYGKLKVPVDQVRINEKTKKYSADKNSLKALTGYTLKEPRDKYKDDVVYDPDDPHGTLKASDLNKMAYPQCAFYLARSALRKNVTAYHNGILNNVKDNGRYHPHIISSKTDTYRDTERTQITKGPIKGTIGSPNTKRFDYTADDYMAEEFRLASYFSKDNLLSKALSDSEMDPHTKVTAELYNIQEYAVDGKTRKKVKKCNFGIIYGMQEVTLAKNLNEVLFPTDDMIEDARHLYKLYCDKRAELLAGLEVSRAAVQSKGYVYNKLGYRMVYPQVIDVQDLVTQVFDPNRTEPAEPHLDPKKLRNMRRLMTVAGNAPIQSTAAGLLKENYSKLCDELDERGYDETIVSIPITVHDEIGSAFDRYKLYWAEYMDMIVRNFETNLEFLKHEVDIKLFIGVGFGLYWGDAKDDAAELPPKLQQKLIAEWKEGKLKSAEEIGEDLTKYTVDLKVAWFKERLCKLIESTIVDNTIERNKIIYALNHNLYVAKNSAEMIGFKTDAKDLINNANIYIHQYLLIRGYAEDDFTIIDGEPIPEDKVEDPNEGLQSFYTLTQEAEDKGTTLLNFKPHERVSSISKHRLEFITTGLNPITVTNLLEYFKSIANTSYDVRNRRLFFYSGGANFTDTGLDIYGLPVTFRDDINTIIQGGTVIFNRVEHKVNILSDAPLYYQEPGKFIINIKTYQQYPKPFKDALIQILQRYFVPENTLAFPVAYLYYNKDNTLMKDSHNLAAACVPVQLTSDIQKLQSAFSNFKIAEPATK